MRFLSPSSNIWLRASTISELTPIDYLRAWAKLPDLFFTWLDKVFFYLVRLSIIGGILSILWGIVVELTSWTSGRRRITMGIVLVAVGLAPELVGRF